VRGGNKKFNEDADIFQGFGFLSKTIKKYPNLLPN